MSTFQIRLVKRRLGSRMSLHWRGIIYWHHFVKYSGLTDSTFYRSSHWIILRGGKVIKTYATHKNLHILVCLLSTFGPDYHVPS